MNYRQWKKAYKKKHGVNQPDKRKAAKDLASLLNDVMRAVSDEVTQLVNAITPALERMAEQARMILQNMPSLIQFMPEDEFQAMLAEVETEEARAILMRMRYGGDGDGK